MEVEGRGIVELSLEDQLEPDIHIWVSFAAVLKLWGVSTLSS